MEAKGNIPFALVEYSASLQVCAGLNYTTLRRNSMSVAQRDGRGRVV